MISDRMKRILPLKTRQVTLAELQEQLGAFEKRYGMTSAECEAKYRNGSLGDDATIMTWVQDYEAYKELLKHRRPQ